MKLTSAFALIRELCLRAKTAPPHEALAYLEFVMQLTEQSFADMQTQLANRPDLHDDLRLLEGDFVEMHGAMIRLRKVLHDLIEIGGEPVVNLQ